MNGKSLLGRICKFLFYELQLYEVLFKIHYIIDKQNKFYLKLFFYNENYMYTYCSGFLWKNTTCSDRIYVIESLWSSNKQNK